MRVYPMGGTDYYPYVYLGVKPYNTQEEYEPVGKYFAGRSTEYTVSIFLDLIDVETGESATGYPQQVAPTQANFSIVSGGYCRIKAWSLNTAGSAVNITIERHNPTYTKPIEGTYGSANVQPSDALQSYLNTSYYIDGGAGESVLLQSLTATANGTYTAPARTAYDEVVVNVPAPAIVTKHIRGNGIFSAADDNVAGYSDVIVDGSPNDAYFSIVTLSQSNRLEILLKCANTTEKDALVMWGDGSETFGIQKGQTTHTYASVGKYAITVYPIDTSIDTGMGLFYFGFSESSTITCDYVKLPDTKIDYIENNGWGYSNPPCVSISIPAVTKLANGLFQSSTYLKVVYMRGATPPTFPQDSWADPFSGCNLEAIYVPASAVSAYKTASGWSAYADIIQPMPL